MIERPVCVRHRVRSQRPWSLLVTDAKCTRKGGLVGSAELGEWQAGQLERTGGEVPHVATVPPGGAAEHVECPGQRVERPS